MTRNCLTPKLAFTAIVLLAACLPRPAPQTAPTPFPTDSPGEVATLVTLLADEACRPPCYLGITPGITSKGDAERILASVGARQTLDYIDAGFVAEEFDIWLGDSTYAGTPRPTGQVPGTFELAQRITLLVSSEIIERIVVDVGTSSLLQQYALLWKGFSVRDFLLRNHVPDLAVANNLGTVYGILLAYPNEGLVIEFYGTPQGQLVCPSSLGKAVRLHMTITSLSSHLGLYDPHQPLPTKRTVWAPIQEVFGLTESDFHDLIVADPDACILPLIQYP